MDYNYLLDLATDLGYELAMCGAETYRVEESIYRLLESYGVTPEVFAIPNCLTVSIETPDGQLMTRMRRIGYHGNNIDGVERFNGLFRAICSRKPDPKEARRWMDDVCSSRKFYSLPAHLGGAFLGAAGYSLFFGGTWVDCLCAGVCGILIGLVNKFLDDLKANQFFSTMAASFLMAILAYGFGAVGIAPNPDEVIIGALMILVPGLLFTNAMRDVIYGDTNSGVNRIVQVLLVAAAIALGTAAAWALASQLWGTPAGIGPVEYGFFFQGLTCFAGCLGFVIVFNIHGWGGLLCALGGMLTWAVYVISMELTGSELMGYFWGALFASAYSEIMARIRKRCAISYLVISIFPLIPGAGVYFTMNYAVRGNMEMFASRGMYTAAIAGLMAVGILLVSTTVRLYNTWKMQRKK